MKIRRWRSSTVEQLICNQQAAGSIPIASSHGTEGSNEILEKINERSVRTHGRVHRRIVSEGFPSGQREQTVNLSAFVFEGSNPSPSTSRQP